MMHRFVYIIDDASAFMIVLISLMGVFATIYAFESLKKEINKKSQSRVYGMWLLALGGLLGLVTTGDAFNLFVFLEISAFSAIIVLGNLKLELVCVMVIFSIKFSSCNVV